MRQGRVGQAAVFDGKAYLDAGDAADFDIDDRFTLSAWIYSDSTPDGSILTRMQDSPKGKGYGVHARTTARCTSTSPATTTTTRSGSRPKRRSQPKRWYHITVTYNGSRMAEGVHVYIDGKPAKVKVLLDTLYRPFRNAGKLFSEPLRIGAGGGPERRFRGLIDDVHIYGRVLERRRDSRRWRWANRSTRSRANRRPRAAKPRSMRCAGTSSRMPRAPEMREAWKQPARRCSANRKSWSARFPTVMVMAESPVPQRDAPADPRRLRQARRDGASPACRRSCRRCPRARRTTGSGFAKWLVEPGQSAARARHREPLLADVFRHGHREDGRGFRRRRASGRRIRNCSTGWPPSSSAPAGT